jgi:hypothetical protein
MPGDIGRQMIWRELFKGAMALAPYVFFCELIGFGLMGRNKRQACPLPCKAYKGDKHNAKN